MDHYLDLRLRPDPEFSPAQIMNALFANLHRSLVRLGSSDIGISFPEGSDGRIGLGTVMRLHGPEQSLQRLMAVSWLAGVNDHVHASSIRPIPVGAAQHVVRRVQAKSSPERLRRRQMKRKGWTIEQARQAIPDSSGEVLDLPFLVVRSQSSSQSFRLFVSQQPVATQSPGPFNAYGFSAMASLPRF